MKEIISDRRLFLTEDRSRVVEVDDPEAAFLLAPAGGIIYAGDTQRYGLSLTDGKVVIGKASQNASQDSGVTVKAETKRGK